jgi:hypothetical protein
MFSRSSDFLKGLMHETLRYYCMRPSATSVLLSSCFRAEKTYGVGGVPLDLVALELNLCEVVML